MFVSHFRSFLLVPLSALLLMGCGSSLPEEDSTASGVAEKGLAADSQVQSFESCYDQCYRASSSCQQACGATQEQCAAAITLCYDSCSWSTEPWLPC